MNEVYAPSMLVRRRALPRANFFKLGLSIALIIACALGVVAAFRAATHRAALSGSINAVANSSSANNALTSAAPHWIIRGALSETCTCSVPCTCNFGQGPSPHSYCHPFYSFHIRQGNYGDTKLDGLHFGAADLANGQSFFIDQQADAKQREALLRIAARVIEHVAPAETEGKAKELAARVRYTAVKQDYDDRRNHLQVAGLGEFAADYIMGLDDSQPLIVRNNTTWRIKDAIKAKTGIFRVSAGRDSINTKGTNSNQGDFEYTDKTDFGAPADWACGSKMSMNAENKTEHQRMMPSTEMACH